MLNVLSTNWNFPFVLEIMLINNVNPLSKNVFGGILHFSPVLSVKIANVYICVLVLRTTSPRAREKNRKTKMV